MMQIKRKMINIADIMIEDNRWSDFGLQAIANKTFGIVFDALNLSSKWEISILACNDAKITELNFEYRDKALSLYSKFNSVIFASLQASILISHLLDKFKASNTIPNVLFAIACKPKSDHRLSSIIISAILIIFLFICIISTNNFCYHWMAHNIRCIKLNKTNSFYISKYMFSFN